MTLLILTNYYHCFWTSAFLRVLAISIRSIFEYGYSPKFRLNCSSSSTICQISILTVDGNVSSCGIPRHLSYMVRFHDDVIKWKPFPRYWPFVRRIHRSPVNSPHKETRSFDVCFDLRLNKRLSKQSWGWWFETLSRPLWRHCNVKGLYSHTTQTVLIIF